MYVYIIAMEWNGMGVLFIRSVLVAYTGFVCMCVCVCVFKSVLCEKSCR